MCVEGTAVVCSSASDDRDGHGSTTRRTGGRCVGPPATVPTGATVDVLAVDVLTDDVALTDDVWLVEADRVDPPQPASHEHMNAAITAVQRISGIG